MTLPVCGRGFNYSFGKLFPKIPAAVSVGGTPHESWDRGVTERIEQKWGTPVRAGKLAPSAIASSKVMPSARFKTPMPPGHYKEHPARADATI